MAKSLSCKNDIDRCCVPRLPEVDTELKTLRRSVCRETQALHFQKVPRAHKPLQMREEVAVSVESNV